MKVMKGSRGVVLRARAIGILVLCFSLFPAGLALGAAQGNATPDAGATPEAGTEVYESELYGYSLEYDASEWQVLMEDPEPDDVYDQFFLANGVSVVTLIGDPDYAEDEMSACLRTYAAHLESRDTNQNIERLAEPNAEDDQETRTSATYSYDYVPTDSEPESFVRYIECRALDDGITLVIIHDAAAADYEDEIQSRESLLAGLDA